MSGKEFVVYVQLLGEGTICYRPTTAIEISSGIYQIEATDDYDDDDETWEFTPNTLVKCEYLTLAQGVVFAAVKLA